jgi:hypothetical protein
MAPLTHVLLLVSVLALNGACDRGAGAPPTSPTAVDLALSLSTVTLPRYGSVQTTLRLARSDGTSQDVTGAAVWTSMAPAIATVQAGLVTAVGVGTANVAASYGGLTVGLDVVARRNTRLVGAVTVEATGLYGMSPGLPQFFSDNPPDRCGVDRFGGAAQVLAKRFIDHRLVAAARGVGAVSERLEQVVVQVDGDAGLAPLPDHRTPLRFAEVVFLPHTAASLEESPFGPK